MAEKTVTMRGSLCRRTASALGNVVASMRKLMTPTRKGNFWTLVTIVLALLFVVSSVSLITSVHRYQDEVSRNVRLLTNLDEVASTIQHLKHWPEDLNPESPDKSERDWETTYTRYWTTSGKFVQDGNYAQPIRGSLDRIDTLIKQTNSVHFGFISTNSVDREKATQDFTSILNLASKETETAIQSIRFRQQDTSGRLLRNWWYLNGLVVVSCLLATALVVLMILRNRDLARIKQTEESLLHARDDLESMVEQRTRKLASSYKSVLGQVRERKRTETALRESETRFRSLVELSPDGIAVYCEGELTFINSAGAKLFGAAYPDQLVGKSLISLIHPDHINSINSRLFLALEANEISTATEERILRVDGITADVELGAIPYLYDGKRAVQLIIHDITGRKKLEEQLRQSQKMEAVGRLAGGVAHDFNNMLTAIIGYSDFLLSMDDLDKSKRTFLEEIRKAGERATGLTRQLLAFSRKQVIEQKVMDLNSIVIDIERMLHRLIGEDIDLITSLDPALGHVKVDPGQIEQVIMNLSVNARDAMPDGGKLTIRTSSARREEIARLPIAEKADAYVVLEIIDTGTGMDEETIAHCLEPFFTTKESGKGTGLGLSMVYAIVEKSGGHLDLTSELGVGTTFRIFLPQVERRPERPVANAIELLEPSFGSETILVVEDDDVVREMVRELLKNAGYRVLEASNGDDAVEVSDTYDEEIHLLITDMVMPQMNGRDLAKKLTDSRPDIRVLYISGYNQESADRFGLDETEDSFLQKPFNSSVLVSKVREVLGSKHRHTTNPDNRVEVSL